VGLDSRPAHPLVERSVERPGEEASHVVI
jgi:hypothetical protein